MKKYVLTCLTIFGVVSFSHATHLFRNNASNINSGTLANERLDPSSVTLQGNLVDITTVAAGVQSLSDRFTSFASTVQALPRLISYQVVVGTPGTPGVDIQTENHEGFKTAIARLAPSESSQDGGFGTILFRPGRYFLFGTTIPAGITVEGISDVKGSSVVFVVSHTSNNVISNYGTLRNVVIDASTAAYSNYVVRVGSGSRFENVKAIGSYSKSPTYSANLFRFEGSSNVVFDDVTISGDKCHGPITGIYADAGSVFISSATDIKLNLSFNNMNVSGNGSCVFVGNSRRVSFIDGRYREVGGSFFNIDGRNREISILRNDFVIKSPVNDFGFIGLNFMAHTVDITTGVVVGENSFYHNASLGGQIIETENDTPLANGLVIRNNNFINENTTGVTFINIQGANTRNAVIFGNTAYTIGGSLTFISDSGVGTQYTSNSNFKDGIEQ